MNVVGSMVAGSIAWLKVAETWGYDRIASALHNHDRGISDETVGNVLRRHGILPAPARKPKVPWADFIAAHQDTLVGADFFTASEFFAIPEHGRLAHGHAPGAPLDVQKGRG